MSDFETDKEHQLWFRIQTVKNRDLFNKVTEFEIKDIKKQETVLTSEMHWSNIAGKNTSTWLTLVMILNKSSFSLIIA